MKLSVNKLTAEILLFDQRGKIVHVDEATRGHIGLYRVQGRKLMDLLAPACRKRVQGSVDRAFAGESPIEELEFLTSTVCIAKLVRIELENGTPAVAALIFTSADREDMRLAARDCDRETGVVKRGIANVLRRLEMSLEREQAKRLAAQKSSMMDAPTGLHNRAGLDYWLQKEARDAGAEGTCLFLAYLDMDDFKQFNDAHGHLLGDKVLRLISRRLKACSPVICAARVGGDEFAILARYDGTSAELENGLDRILQRIFADARIEGLELRIGGSAGFSILGRDAGDIATLREHADAALIEAKRSGKRRVRAYDARLAEQSRRKTVLRRDLPLAMEAGSIRAVYQPIVPAGKEKRYGVEVLSRWDHYEFGSIPAHEFIALACETGCISDLDVYIARTACRDIAPLIRRGLVDFLSLNIAPQELSRSAHVDRLIQVIQTSGIEPSRICVEVTESEIISDIENARWAISRIKEAGMSIALDDYGVGYSNLRALLDLPIDKLKIDRSLVHELATDERTMRVVFSVIHLARIFSADLVAEGIETRAQAYVAKAMGCQYLQGYAFSRPLARDALESWLRRQNGLDLFSGIEAVECLQETA